MSIAISGSSITFPDQTQMSTAVGGSFRNRIINGDMRIDQRNAGAVHTPIANTYSIDRWNFQLSQASKLTAQRQAVANPYQVDNNTFTLNATSTSAYSVTSSDYFLIGQFIEGFNSADLGWGSSGAKTVTISFWVYSSLTGTFGGVLQNSAITRSYPFTYSISSANTWQKKTITITGDTSGTWVTDNGLGIRLYFGLGAGSTVSGTAGSWASANYLSATGATSVVGTNGATFYITGVQLEAGSTATNFERRPIGIELALCQRYFQKTYDVETVQATATNLGMVYVGSTTTGLYGQAGVQYASNMRSIPSIRYWDGAGNENKCSYIVNNSASTSFVANINLSAAPYNISTRGFLVGANVVANSASYIHYTANSEL